MQPELLSGTLRQNLDPFSQHDDATLNDALRAAGLFSLQSETDEGRLTLDSAISSGGSNLFNGETFKDTIHTLWPPIWRVGSDIAKKMVGGSR